MRQHSINNMRLPTVKTIKRLHFKYAPNKKTFLLVFTHCQIVKEISEQLIKENNLIIHKGLVVAGSLLHDIGVYKLMNKRGVFDESNYIRHGVEGYRILSQEGFPEELCLIAERHTGVGISKNEVIRQKLSLPVRDYLALTLEEKIIMYADKFHSKSSHLNSFNTYSLYIKRFGQSKVKKFQSLARLFGVPNLELLAKKYHQLIV